MSGAAVALFDSLAENYEQHFAEPHRRAYDDLAWELVSTRLPDRPGTIVDVGCGTGRWARRLLRLGHRVIGIEPAPKMAARAETLTGTGRFTLVRSDLEHADLPAAGADLVLAMGSLQYSQDLGRGSGPPGRLDPSRCKCVRAGGFPDRPGRRAVPARRDRYRPAAVVATAGTMADRRSAGRLDLVRRGGDGCCLRRRRAFGR